MKVVINTCYGGFSLSLEAVSAWESRTGKVFDEWEIPRHDPDLVAIVMLFGNAANTDSSELEVATIPGTQYHITNNDGIETLRTPENIPWVTVDDSDTTEPPMPMPLQQKMWPHKRRVIIKDLQENQHQYRDWWQYPNEDDSFEQNLNNSVYLDKIAVFGAAIKHLSNTELVDPLISQLEHQLLRLRDRLHWESNSFDGYTDHIHDTAGLAFALSLAIPVATYVEDPDEDLLARMESAEE